MELVGTFFASRPRARPIGALGKTVFLFLPYKAWTNGVRVPLGMPYKVERGRQSFLRPPTDLAFDLEAKNVPTELVFF